MWVHHAVINPPQLAILTLPSFCPSNPSSVPTPHPSIFPDLSFHVFIHLSLFCPGACYPLTDLQIIIHRIVYLWPYLPIQASIHSEHSPVPPSTCIPLRLSMHLQLSTVIHTFILYPSYLISTHTSMDLSAVHQSFPHLYPSSHPSIHSCPSAPTHRVPCLLVHLLLYPSMEVFPEHHIPQPDTRTP